MMDKYLVPKCRNWGFNWINTVSLKNLVMNNSRRENS
jgi:hypothetical protein